MGKYGLNHEHYTFGHFYGTIHHSQTGCEKDERMRIMKTGQITIVVQIILSSPFVLLPASFNFRLNVHVRISLGSLSLIKGLVQSK